MEKTTEKKHCFFDFNELPDSWQGQFLCNVLAGGQKDSNMVGGESFILKQ